MGRGRRRGLAPLRKAWGVNVSLLRGQRSANGRRVAEHPGKRAGAEADGENGERLAGDDLRNLLAGRSGKPPNLSRVFPQDSLRRSPSATSRALSRFFILRACVALCLALCPVFPAPRRSADLTRPRRVVPPWPQVVLPAFPPRSPFFPQASALSDGPCRGLSFCDRLCLSRGCPVHPRSFPHPCPLPFPRPPSSALCPRLVCRKSSAVAVRAVRSHARSWYLIKMTFFFN